MALAWKDRCRAFLEDEGGWERLVKVASAPDHIDALPALKLMAEYAYGKPQQHVDVTTQGGPLFKAYVSVDTDRV